MSTIKTFYQRLIRTGNHLQSPLLLALRLGWGWAFLIVGLGKWSNIDGVASFFNSLGIPFPLFTAYLVATVELVGGLLLLAGLAARLTGLILSINMVVAYLLAHSDSLKRFFEQPALVSHEAPFMYLLTALAVLAFGPGTYSLDALLKRWYFKGR